MCYPFREMEQENVMQTPWDMEEKENRPYDRMTFLWNVILFVLLSAWSLMVLRAPWGSLRHSIFPEAAVAAGIGILCVFAAAVRNRWIQTGLFVVPWLALAFGAAEVRQGLLLWMNCVLTLWNQKHESALALFPANATARSMTVLSLYAVVALGQLIWWIIRQRKLLVLGIGAAALLLLQLLTGSFLPLAWGLGAGAFTGLWMSSGNQEKRMPRQTIRIWMVCMALFLLCALPGAEKELSVVSGFRNELLQTVEKLRYGEDPLPQGQLEAAARLDQGDDEVMRVQTGQEKTLYLRAFTGAQLVDGNWQELSDAAYGGTYAGMLKWLAKQGFDPVTQPASYYALCGDDSMPEVNSLTVTVTGGSRKYLYLPASTDDISVAHRENRDLSFTPGGVFGAASYTIEEYSSARPSELMIWEDWVAEPETEEQKAYVQAESMYRSFVYDSYTQTDAGLQPLLEALFWNGYDPESDSVYSAIDHIRSVLKQNTLYDPQPVATSDGTEILRDFLKGKQQGNAVMYATAAVEALRAKGIPARYVEGYHLSSAAVAQSTDGTVSLTGEDAHAWAEIYFDGIGWLPVDFTPGYYYDTVTLSQMVSMPDTVKKTAALDNEGSGGGENVSMDPKPAEHTEPVEAAVDALLLLLGIAAVAVLTLTIWFLGWKLQRSVSVYRKKQKYLRSDISGKTQMLKRWIYETLTASGITASLGWKTEEIDAAVTGHFPEVEPGEYTRVVGLLEKFCYGGIELEVFELRAVQAFLRKVTE